MNENKLKIEHEDVEKTETNPSLTSENEEEENTTTDDLLGCDMMTYCAPV